MLAVRFGSLRLALLFATAFSVSILPNAGQAYTPEQQAACSDDAMRLCSSEIPDVDRITACMVKRKSELSPGCRVYFRSEPETGRSASAGKPLSIKPASVK
jgi:hypothetical protein